MQKIKSIQFLISKTNCKIGFRFEILFLPLVTFHISIKAAIPLGINTNNDVSSSIKYRNIILWLESNLNYIIFGAYS